MSMGGILSGAGFTTLNIIGPSGSVVYQVRSRFAGISNWTNILNSFSDWGELTNSWDWTELMVKEVHPQNVLNIEIERGFSDFRSRLRTGTSNIVIDNKEENYSPDNSEETHVGDELSIKAKGSDETWRGLFQGFIKELDLDPDTEIVQLGSEGLESLFRKTINLELQTDTKPSSLVKLITDAVDFSDTSIDTIGDNVPFSLIDDQSAGSAIGEVKNSGGHIVFVDGEGIFNFKERSSTKSLSVVASYDQFLNFNYTINDEKVINRAEISSRPREVTSDPKTIAWLNNAPKVEAGDNIEFKLSYQNPENRASDTPADSITSIKSADWMMNTSSDGGGTDLTNQASVTIDVFARSSSITFRNTSSKDGFVTKMQLRGFPILEQPQIEVISQVDTSVNRFGENLVEISNDLIPKENHANSYANFIVDRFHNHLPDLDAAIKNRFPDVVKNDLFTKFHIVNSRTNVKTEFVVEGLTHTIDFRDGLQHSVEYNLSVFNE